jgi:hypothetical protein
VKAAGRDTTEVPAVPSGTRIEVARFLFPAIAALVVLVTLPVIVRGEPLADDYHTCLRPTEIGLDGFLGESARRLGAVRPARFLEIFAIAPLCRHVPFGVVIVFPLALTLLVAYLLRGLLRDLGLRGPWPDMGAVIWLLHPVGAEASLWPSALHVPLGLAFALGALRLYRRGQGVWATFAALGAFLSLEQSVFALPLAVWMVTRPEERQRATAVTGIMAVAVSTAYVLWPGTDPRAAVPLGERVAAVFTDPLWYVEFPATGVGVHSIPVALRWALPLSPIVVAIGVVLGLRLRKEIVGHSLSGHPRFDSIVRWGIGIAVLLILVNLPLMTTVPRGDSPRTFSPTWLVLSALVPIMAEKVRVPRTRWFWGAAGAFIAGSLLAIALSVSVRLQTADFTVASSRYLAARTSDGAVIAVCGVRRAAVSPAPSGSFSLHELIYTWSAQDALRYNTGRLAEFRLGGALWGTECPDVEGADLVVTFDQLRRVAGLPSP